jgi:hypothetical protein
VTDSTYADISQMNKWPSLGGWSTARRRARWHSGSHLPTRKDEHGASGGPRRASTPQGCSLVVHAFCATLRAGRSPGCPSMGPSVFVARSLSESNRRLHQLPFPAVRLIEGRSSPSLAGRSAVERSVGWRPTRAAEASPRCLGSAELTQQRDVLFEPYPTISRRRSRAPTWRGSC